jgi:very-short-patch-repair endonuclease
MEAPARTRRFAKELRRTMSLPEVLLWLQVRGQRLEGLHFRRQHPVGPYILDFYCDAARLCVEVDGYGHGTADHPERDARRDAWLAGRGVRTLRIPASEVLSDMDGALRTILAAAGVAASP